jgi:hypothetical protein
MKFIQLTRNFIRDSFQSFDHAGSAQNIHTNVWYFGSSDYRIKIMVMPFDNSRVLVIVALTDYIFKNSGADASKYFSWHIIINEEDDLTDLKRELRTSALN